MILLTALIPFAPVGLFAGAGWELQQYQTNFYASLVRQVHAQQPVFADRLTFDDGRWPVVSDDQFHQSWFYQDGAYHVRAENSMQTVAAPGPGSYGDAAVQVTVAQRYRGMSGGVGLLLRSSEGNRDFVVFQVSPKGQWALLRYHDVGDPARGWQSIWHGESKAIHQGVGVQNRLLVIVQDRRYLCYVNEQFLGVYEDNGPALAQGRMGVFVNESPTEGIFTDFAVYPAPSTDIFTKD